MAFKHFFLNRIVIYVIGIIGLVYSLISFAQNNDEMLSLGTEAADYAGLSDAVYHDGGEIPAGYTRLEGYSEDTPSSGFFAEVYQAQEGHPNEGEIVIAFRGTEIGITDIATDLNANLFNQHDAQYTQAYRFAERIKQKFGNDHVIRTTGHSLGGALAQFASASHDLPAYTFNSAQVNHRLRSTLNNDFHDNIINIVHEDDPLHIGNFFTENVPGIFAPRTSHLGPVTMVDYTHEYDQGILQRIANPFLGIFGMRNDAMRIYNNHSIVPMRRALEDWRSANIAKNKFLNNYKKKSKDTLEVKELSDPFKE